MQLELLAPAANKEIAIAAVNCGADAVYMGGPRFGARSKAGNSISEIEQCVRYAHFYGAKIYVTLNTLLFDYEWEDALRIANSCYEIGVDALIVQDMGWLEHDLPPIALHASTQCDIRSVEKACFLAQAGFSRLVLARELSLDQMRQIHEQTQVEIEAFIHGSLCVSYSGQCYLSQAMFGRSGNRGECSQACRLPYDLVSEKGQVLCAQQHLLSLKDLNLSSFLCQMALAGVCSFKIEGRLKDEYYVRNVTAYYRKLLDACIDKEAEFESASWGKAEHFFIPNVEKGFHRPYTTYNIEGQRQKMASLFTPKAIGEYVGHVLSVRERDGVAAEIEIQTQLELQAGDGLCFFDKDRQLVGFGVNAVTRRGGRVWICPGRDVFIEAHAELYRNQDIQFERNLHERSAQRSVELNGVFSKEGSFYWMRVRDEEGVEIAAKWPCTDFAPAEHEEKMRENFIKQMSKSGDFPFRWKQIDMEVEKPFPFIPLGMMNQWRRSLLEELQTQRISMHRPVDDVRRDRAGIYKDDDGNPLKTLDFRANVGNQFSRCFYRKHGIESITPAFELEKKKEKDKNPLMCCKYCIKYELEQCSRYFPHTLAVFEENLYLKYKDHKFALYFDCVHERMEIRKNGDKEK